METKAAVAIAILLILFNGWSIFKKYKSMSYSDTGKFFLISIKLNVFAGLLGIYLLLMIKGQTVLLKAVTFIIGLLLVTDGAFEMLIHVREYRNTGWLFIFLFQSVTSIGEILLGIILIDIMLF